MKVLKRYLTVSSILSTLVLSFQAQASLSFNVSADNYDASAFGAGSGGWVSGNLSLPDQTSLDPNGLELNIYLSHDLTLNSGGLGFNYGFGMGGFTPQIQPNGDAFSFSIGLLKNGVLITPAFGFDQTNPFNFDVDNLSVTTSTGVVDPNLTFDQINILVSNSDPNGVVVTDFSVKLGDFPSPVPEPTTVIAGVLMLMPFGIGALRKRSRVV